MDVPECSLLAVQDLPLCLVLLPVDPVSRGTTSRSHREHTPLKYQVTYNESVPRMMILSRKKYTRLHHRQADLGSKS